MNQQAPTSTAAKATEAATARGKRRDGSRRSAASVGSRIHSTHSATASKISITAPIATTWKNPTKGIRNRLPSTAPRIAPSVFHAYTWPVQRSSPCRAHKRRVPSGNVMPAKKAAGIMVTALKRYCTTAWKGQASTVRIRIRLTRNDAWKSWTWQSNGTTAQAAMATCARMRARNGCRGARLWM